MAASGVEHLWAAGALCADAVRAYGSGARHFASTAALLGALGQAPACASVLVKGSRFMRMEQVVTALQSAGTAAPAKDAHAV